MVARAIVVTPISSSVPLGVYMQPFASAAFPVREVDLVALAQRSALFSGAQPPPRPAGHPPPAPGLRLVEQRYTSTYSLLRFRSAQPVTIPPAALLFNRLDSRAAVVLFQR